MSATTTRRRVAVRVDGVVQGVGFRPFVHRLAGELALAGEVSNDARGVLADVEGDPTAVEAFLARLATDAPPLAHVEAVAADDLPPAGREGFVIAPSGEGAPRALVAPDGATCAACLAEVRDPAGRRFRYPFTTCTDCGPRFSIVLGVPYDRARTTMAGFAMCDACRAEYEDPRDRRFHAEPIACPACGPRARLVDPAGREVAHAALGAVDAVGAAAQALRNGAIVAVKGLGGFHLACRADHEPAVAALRARKRREDKPFALMPPDLAGARALVVLGPQDEATLLGVERPIVLAPRRPRARVARSVAPRSADLGVLLPYTPLHHLLLEDAGTTLVMTSGNLTDEPIAFRDEDALARLGAVADLLLLHDRPIHTRVEDSVVRGGVPLRRSRGFVPAGLPVPEGPPLLAVGGELKSTCCVARAGRAWVGPHAGDLTTPEALEAFEHGAAHLQRLFGVVPEVVAHDLHPDYASTSHARELDGVRLSAVQHHHAHLAAALAEHGEPGPAIGAIFDGAGLGPDGTVWGGEVLAGDLGGFTRVGHLRPVRLPGGDRAAREPWRMACAWLQEALGEEPAPLPRTDPRRWAQVAALARTDLAPVTTSAGRLFDAVAALCGVRLVTTYEGQAAIELEACCDDAERGAYELDGLDPRPAVRAIARDVARGVAPGVVAARFHAGLARATAAACATAASAAGTEVVVLSGGVFANRRLREATAAALRDAGLRVLVPRRLPAGDGGLSYGQAAVAAAREGTVVGRPG